MVVELAKNVYLLEDEHIIVFGENLEDEDVVEIISWKALKNNAKFKTDRLVSFPEEHKSSNPIDITPIIPLFVYIGIMTHMLLKRLAFSGVLDVEMFRDSWQIYKKLLLYHLNEERAPLYKTFEDFEKQGLLDNLCREIWELIRWPINNEDKYKLRERFKDIEEIYNRYAGMLKTEEE